MKILFVIPPPYLPNRLHRMRSFDLIRILAKKHEVHLLSIATQKETPKELGQIRKICKSVKIIYLNPLRAWLNCLRFLFLPAEAAFCYSEKVKKEMQEIIKREKIDVVYLKRLRSAIYFCNSAVPTSKESRSLPRHLRGDYNRVILDTTDAMSMFYFRMYKSHSFPKNLFYLWQAVLYKRFEKRTMEKIKNWIVCSEIDKKYLQELREEVKIHVVSNPVDTEYFSPQYLPSSPWGRHGFLRQLADSACHPRGGVASAAHLGGEIHNSLLFRGLMDKPVNIDACSFFVKEILPKVQEKIKDIKLFIVGQKPHRSIQKLHNGKNIFVTGYVKDVREFIGKTDISICPVRIASGTRYKILQAWSMGRPVVSTAIGAEGLFYKNDYNIAIANTPEGFAEKIVSLLLDKKYYTTLQKNGLKTVEKKYTLKAVGEKLERVLNYVYKKK